MNSVAYKMKLCFPESIRSMCCHFCSVVSNSLPGLQHARLPHPSLSLRVCSNSHPLNWLCHPTVLSSVAPLSSCPQTFPSSGWFPMSQHLASGGQSIGVSASASVHPMNIHSWFPLGLTSLTSLQSNGLSRVFSNTTVLKHQFFCTQPSFWSSSHIHTWLMEKPLSLTIWTFVDKVMSLLFSTLSKFFIAFTPRSKHLLISWLQSLSTVILEPKKI